MVAIGPIRPAVPKTTSEK